MAKILKSNSVLKHANKEAFLKEVEAEQGAAVAAEVEMEIDAGALILSDETGAMTVSSEEVGKIEDVLKDATGATDTQKVDDALKVLAPKASETAKEIVKLALPKETKELPANLIVPAGTVMGKERWFVKSKMAAVEVVDGLFIVSLTRGEVASRGLLDQIIQ